MKVHLGSRSNVDTLEAIRMGSLCIVYGRHEDDGTIYLTIKPRKEGRKECE